MIQVADGKKWEDKVIARILKLTIYVPHGTLDATKIRAIDKSTLIRYIEAEGYGK